MLGVLSAYVSWLTVAYCSNQERGTLAHGRAGAFAATAVFHHRSELKHFASRRRPLLFRPVRLLVYGLTVFLAPSHLDIACATPSAKQTGAFSSSMTSSTRCSIAAVTFRCLWDDASLPCHAAEGERRVGGVPPGAPETIAFRSGSLVAHELAPALWPTAVMNLQRDTYGAHINDFCSANAFIGSRMFFLVQREQVPLGLTWEATFGFLA